MSLVTKLDKSENFEEFLNQNKQFLVMVYFSANWSEECKHMNEFFNELLLKNKKYANTFKILDVEAEDNEELSLKYGIEVVPSYVFIKNHQILHQTSGADVTLLSKKINEILQLNETSNVSQEEDKTAAMNARLAKLIHSAPVMLFMKGTPQEARCGFSRQTVDLLKSKNVSFSTFDILSDNDVRESLKVYSKWPTYPQIYINGELVGGLDILKELIESGEFDSMLPKKEDTLNNRLKKLINQHKIMLFMKGTQQQPKCGFSRQIIEILNETGYKYDTFDILSDEDVRNGLKEYSKWPTYPQLYVNGELVGGLDIVKELKENGELDETLKSSV